MSELNANNVGQVIGKIKSSGYTRAFWVKYRPAACKGSGVGAALDAMAKAGLKGGSRSVSGIKAFEALKAIQEANARLTAALSKALGKAKSDAVAKQFITAFKKDAGGPFEKDLVAALQRAKAAAEQAELEAREAEQIALYEHFLKVGRGDLRDFEKGDARVKDSLKELGGRMNDWQKAVKKLSEKDALLKHCYDTQVALSKWVAAERKQHETIVKWANKYCGDCQTQLKKPKYVPVSRTVAPKHKECQSLADTAETMAGVIEDSAKEFDDAMKNAIMVIKKKMAEVAKMENPAAEGR